jgi:hypothetical protein
MFLEGYHRHLLGVDIGEHKKGLHRSIRVLALSVGQVVAESVLVPHLDATVLTDERYLLPSVLAMLPRPWLRHTPQQTILDEACL